MLLSYTIEVQYNTSSLGGFYIRRPHKCCIYILR
uniref:PLDP1 n=1 Tax=Arundo donax TaxID=35708 RepID=A0A0A8YVU1_ARUDO